MWSDDVTARPSEVGVPPPTDMASRNDVATQFVCLPCKNIRISRLSVPARTPLVMLSGPIMRFQSEALALSACVFVLETLAVSVVGGFTT